MADFKDFEWNAEIETKDKISPNDQLIQEWKEAEIGFGEETQLIIKNPLGRRFFWNHGWRQAESCIWMDRERWKTIPPQYLKT